MQTKLKNTNASDGCLTAYRAHCSSVAAGQQTKACRKTRAYAWVQISDLNTGGKACDALSDTRGGGGVGGWTLATSPLIAPTEHTANMFVKMMGTR
jgi:hypothetical protein